MRFYLQLLSDSEINHADPSTETRDDLPIFYYIHSYHFKASFSALSRAIWKKVPSLTWVAAYILIALLQSGWASIPKIV